MTALTIDNIQITVPQGTTILKAAEKAGIEIHTMCYDENVPNHASCMVCAVKINGRDEFHPACETKAQEGMVVKSNDPEVFETRREALELLLSDHVGDCEAPCRTTCPAYMNIPLMNRLIAEGKYIEALKVVKEEIALPLVLGYICQAPCEKACRRRQADEAISICQLKKFTGVEDAKAQEAFLPVKEAFSNKKVAIIGTGPTGLAAAFYLLKHGHGCVLFDKNEKAGGSLKNLPETEMPQHVLETELEILLKYGAEFRLGQTVDLKAIENELSLEFKAVIIATGIGNLSGRNEFSHLLANTSGENNEKPYATNQKGIFACGSVLNPVKMAVKAVAIGKEAAFAVHSFLGGNVSCKQTRMFNSKFGKLSDLEVGEYMKEASTGIRVNPEKGNLPGFIPEEAVAEAKRCMRCDCRKPKSCKLRINADKYNARQRKYIFGERKTIQKYFQTDVVVYEPEKCIKCGLCIEIASNNNELAGLAFIGRGFDMRIDIPFSKSLGEAIANSAIECINGCPTGALSGFGGE